MIDCAKFLADCAKISPAGVEPIISTCHSQKLHMNPNKMPHPVQVAYGQKTDSRPVEVDGGDSKGFGFQLTHPGPMSAQEFQFLEKHWGFYDVFVSAPAFTPIAAKVIIIGVWV